MFAVMRYAANSKTEGNKCKRSFEGSEQEEKAARTYLRTELWKCHRSARNGSSNDRAWRREVLDRGLLMRYLLERNCIALEKA